MKPEHDPAHLTRRDALRQTLLASLGLTAVQTEASVPVVKSANQPFVPENDYPFFGWDPGDGLESSP